MRGESHMLKWILSQEKRITWIVAALIVLGLLLRFTQQQPYGDIALIVATFIAVAPIAIKAFQALRYKTFSIELLVTIAVIGALYIGEYIESSVVTFLFLFGSYLEARTLDKTRSSIRELTDMAPQEANLMMPDGSRQVVSVDDISVGDRLVILPGGKVPVDGIVISGSASINEASVTGESTPVDKEVDDYVYSGTIADDGYLEIIAEKVGDDTTFAKIIELVEEAQDSKSKTERFLDRFAQYYTPLVAALSLLVYAVTKDLHLSITFLVIACPGALVIGAPVSNVAGIGNGAKNGVLIKGGEVIENLSKVNTLVFDKTGTLTKGKPEVTEIKQFTELDRNLLYGLIGRAEMISEHHLGKTIVNYVKNQDINLNQYQLEAGEAIKGKGVTATIEGHKLILGNRALLQDGGMIIPDEIEDYAVQRERAGNTAIFVTVNDEIAAIVSIADQIRDEAKQALAKLREQGIERIIMLTGDNRHTAEAVANELGLDEFHAELLPEDKVTHVKRLKAQGAIIGMTGDGVNDAPAIATADVGVAMGISGTDVSMETADVVLMADRLDQYAHAYSLAKSTMANMKQNIFIALAVVVFLLAGVMIGFINLASGMFVHEGSVLAVILNAMRLIKFRTR